MLMLRPKVVLLIWLGLSHLSLSNAANDELVTNSNASEQDAAFCDQFARELRQLPVGTKFFRCDVLAFRAKSEFRKPNWRPWTSKELRVRRELVGWIVKRLAVSSHSTNQLKFDSNSTVTRWALEEIERGAIAVSEATVKMSGLEGHRRVIRYETGRCKPKDTFVEPRQYFGLLSPTGSAVERMLVTQGEGRWDVTPADMILYRGQAILVEFSDDEALWIPEKACRIKSVGEPAGAAKWRPALAPAN